MRAANILEEEEVEEDEEEEVEEQDNQQYGVGFAEDQQRAILEDSATIKEGLQPYLVKKLDVIYSYDLERTLSIVTPSDELVVRNDSILSKEQIRAIESLGLKRLEIQSW